MKENEENKGTNPAQESRNQPDDTSAEWLRGAATRMGISGQTMIQELSRSSSFVAVGGHTGTIVGGVPVAVGGVGGATGPGVGTSGGNEGTGGDLSGGAGGGTGLDVSGDDPTRQGTRGAGSTTEDDDAGITRNAPDSGGGENEGSVGGHIVDLGGRPGSSGIDDY